MEKKYILFFDETDKNDLPLVGGKGANLGEMTLAGFPVPSGFCVTTESYKDFLHLNNLPEFIAQIIKAANIDNINEIGDQIRAKIQQSAIPEKVEQEIIKSFNKLGVDNYYAVRSSATAEDLAFASFAGQQDTYLNIMGKKALLDSVRNCWASLFTDRAILYRIQNKIEHEKVHMSVVIQKMLLPEVSGIMFTADPISGHRKLISIDASYGLGEALVSGLVSPDIYRYNKSNSEIETKTIAEKKLAIMPIEGGGTKKIEITAEKATSQVLQDLQIKSLAELGMAIEKHYGCPQDIEWCLEDNKLYIVQSRAITSLFPMPEPIPKDEALHAYVSFNHFQVMTNPISPLGIDMLRMIFPFDKGARSAEDYRVIKSAAGRIYLDLSDILQYKKPREVVSSFLKNADALMSQALKELISRPDFEAEIKKNKSSGKALRKFFKPIVFKAVKNVTYRKPEGTVEFIKSYIDKRTKEAAKAINNAKQGIEKLEAIYKSADFSDDFQVLLPIMAPAMLSFKALEAQEEKLLGEHKHVDIIVKGLEGNITTEMGLLVGDLADMVRISPDLIREFTNENYNTLIDRINKLKDNEKFKKNFNNFIDIYDMRAAGEIDMAKDRWIENPEPLAKAIMSIVNTSEEGIHRKEYKETIERAKKASAELIKEVEEKHRKVKGKVVRRMVRVLRNYMPIREHPKYLIMKLILIYKKAFLEEASLLVEKGHLLEEKDVFYVGFWELYKAIKNNNSLVELVKLRKEEYEHFNKLTPPRLITSDGEEIKAGYKRDNLPEGALPGMPVSSGVIEGIARVITDPSKTSINKGEILVAPFTDPGWTPLFINAAGLVMEVGGLLTHGTVVAREYGIPAVVGITDATKKIKTGQKIRVDGNAGFVLIIEE
ncbi:phosphoenolpyruvate synthase [Clostridium zeae]|uniref:Phosphoenolpyruvate synthase n=1 Tax=Clostridium zeae TaxID=2759022 RepID=A0ABQ1EF49_9CLOT|nr:phosphoenolpyruvate synthase [Clostridium zeae]GFZ33168.1 phosphoenolpyruvate synthase [Clostridium zeae]